VGGLSGTLCSVLCAGWIGLDLKIGQIDSSSGTKWSKARATPITHSLDLGQPFTTRAFAALIDEIGRECLFLSWSTGPPTAVAQTLLELTFAPQFKPIPSLITRMESRYDKSNQNVLQIAGSSKSYPPTLSFEVIYLV